MSTALRGATSVPRGALTRHSGGRAGMADVEQRDRPGCASGGVELGMQDAGLVCTFTHQLYSSAGRGAEDCESVFASVCGKKM